MNRGNRAFWMFLGVSSFVIVAPIFTPENTKESIVLLSASQGLGAALLAYFFEDWKAIFKTDVGYLGVIILAILNLLAGQLLVFGVTMALISLLRRSVDMWEKWKIEKINREYSQLDE